MSGLRLGFGPRGWDLSLEARIWALRLEFGPQDLDMSFKGGGRTEEEKEEKFALFESIGHRPLRGRCPIKTKADVGGC